MDRKLKLHETDELLMEDLLNNFENSDLSGSDDSGDEVRLDENDYLDSTGVDILVRNVVPNVNSKVDLGFIDTSTPLSPSISNEKLLVEPSSISLSIHLEPNELVEPVASVSDETATINNFDEIFYQEINKVGLSLENETAYDKGPVEPF